MEIDQPKFYDVWRLGLHRMPLCPSECLYALISYSILYCNKHVQILELRQFIGISPYEKNKFLPMRKTKMQNSCAVTAQLISQRLCSCYTDSTMALLIKSKILLLGLLCDCTDRFCVGLGQKPQRSVFSQRGSFPAQCFFCDLFLPDSLRLIPEAPPTLDRFPAAELLLPNPAVLLVLPPLASNT